MEEPAKNPGGPQPDRGGRGAPTRSSMLPFRLPGRREYQPPSEISTSEEDPGRRPPQAAPPEECSEGSWIKLDAAELQQRRALVTSPQAAAARQAADSGPRTSPLPWFVDQMSATDLLVSSDSSSTKDEPAGEGSDSPAKENKTRPLVPLPPPPPAESAAVDTIAASPPAGSSDLRSVNALEDDVCLGEPTPDYLPAVLKVYDTESTQEHTSSSAAGDDFGTGMEAATTVSGAAVSGESSTQSDSRRRRDSSWLAFRRTTGLPVTDLAPTEAKAGVNELDTKMTPAEIQTAAAEPTRDTSSLANELPAAASPTITVSQEPAATKSPATLSSPARISTDSDAVRAPDTSLPPKEGEAEGADTQTATSSTAQAPARPNEELEPHAAGSLLPCTVPPPPVLPRETPTERPLRLQRTPLARKHAEECGDRSGKATPVVPDTHEKTRLSYLNELELHNTVTAKLQRTPMRLLVFDLLLAFLLVIFSQMEMLGLRGNTTATTTPSEGPALLYERPVCRGAACSAAGINLFYTLNESADACQSIFDVVCRPWVHETPSTYLRALVGSARLATATVFEETTKFLESRLTKASPSTGQGKLASLYARCRDHDERDRAGFAYFRGLLRRYQLDQWPFGDDHLGLSRPQGALELFTRDTGAEPYFTLRLRTLRNGSTLAIGCPLLGLPPLSFIFKTADVGRYTEYVGSILKLVAGPSAALTNVPATVVDFETSLARLHVASCKKGGTYRTKRLRDLVDTKWNWEHFLQEVTERAVTNDHVQSASWEYASNVTGFIVSDSAAAANYFGWKVVSRLAPYTTTSMEDTYNAFLEATGLETHRPSRRCLTQVNRVLPFAMGRAYAMISPETSTNYQAYLVAHEVARSLDAYMVKDGQPLASEVETLYRKLRSTMELTMGYPDWVQDEASVDAYYEPVTIAGSYLESHLSAAKVTYQRSFDPRVSLGGRERLMFPEDPERWTLDPAWLSLYDIQDNRFYLLPAVLQPPFYVEGTTHSLNYGGLGFLLARSILSELLSLSVESTVSPLPGSPSLAKSVQLLRARLLKSSRAGANNRSSEALAASIAYLSFHMHGDFRDEQTVEGAETLTPDQIFFIAVARTLCTLARSRYYVRVVGQRAEVDALSEIDNALLSLPEYRDAFGCNGTLR